MKPQYLQTDNLDDRREIYYLLARLSPRRRIAFLRWACQTAVLPCSTVRPRVLQKTEDLARLAERDDSADERLTLEIFFDVWHLCLSYKFDLDNALARLVQIVR